MNNLSFWHCASDKPKATEFAVLNVRKHHPNNYYHLCVDGRFLDEHYKIAKKYDCDFVYYDKSLGGPKQPFGYDEGGMITFLSRFQFGMIQAKLQNYSHMIMMEDDVLVLNSITVDPYWEHACHNITHDNFLPNELKTIFKDLAQHNLGIVPNFPSYGAGGGSIFKIDTFLDNFYEKVNLLKFIKKTMWEKVQYPTIGWIDCFMNIFYYLSGKEYSINPHLVDTHNHNPKFDYDLFVSQLNPDVQIVNNYKRMYFNE